MRRTDPGPLPLWPGGAERRGTSRQPGHDEYLADNKGLSLDIEIEGALSILLNGRQTGSSPRSRVNLLLIHKLLPTTTATSPEHPRPCRQYSNAYHDEAHPGALPAKKHIDLSAFSIKQRRLR